MPDGTHGSIASLNLLECYGYSTPTGTPSVLTRKHVLMIQYAIACLCSIIILTTRRSQLQPAKFLKLKLQFLDLVTSA